ncbi:MAG: hypothetical protein IT514_06105, partial [Burkholderiales bacterium]|nr:hypothetical protein [Burkholderiales bacterium]
MTANTAAQDRADFGTRLAILRGAGGFALPFLRPAHYPPVPSFYDEWLGAALTTSACLSFALGTLGTRESRWYAPELAWMLAALAAWLLLQCLLR